MNDPYDAGKITKIFISVQTIQDLLAMLKECYFSEDKPEQFQDWAMTVFNVTEPLFPDIIDFLSWAQINVPDYVKAAKPEQEEPA
jgi:hypothetical protein